MPTGMGLKFRAHPLAVAIAQSQFLHLDRWLEQKAKFARKLNEGLSGLRGLRLPKVRSK